MNGKDVISVLSVKERVEDSGLKMVCSGDTITLENSGGGVMGAFSTIAEVDIFIFGYECGVEDTNEDMDEETHG